MKCQNKKNHTGIEQIAALRPEATHSTLIAGETTLICANCAGELFQHATLISPKKESPHEEVETLANLIKRAITR